MGTQNLERGGLKQKRKQVMASERSRASAAPDPWPRFAVWAAPVAVALLAFVHTLPYKFVLPTANHVFLPGHRIMVQVQSTWFPLYDRNPQTFVVNIFFAKPEDYVKATQRVYHAEGAASFIDLPVVPAR